MVTTRHGTLHGFTTKRSAKMSSKPTLQPPPGAEVKTKQEWSTRIPDQPEIGPHSLGLDDDEPGGPALLAEPIFDEDQEPDELTTWLESFADNNNLDANVVRQRDPNNTRFRNPCTEQRALGRIPFRVETFVADIRALEDSGGRFKVSLVDPARSRFIPGGCWTGNISDPPRREAPEQPAAPATVVTAAPAAATASEFTKALEQMQLEIMRKNLARLTALDSPAPAAGNGTEYGKAQTIAEFLMADESVKKAAIKNLIGLTGTGVEPELTGWQSVTQKVFENPAVVTALTPVLGDIIGLLQVLAKATANRFVSAVAPNAPPPQPQPQQITAPPPPARTEDELPIDDDPPPHYIALDALMANLRANATVEPTAPWLTALRENYPTEWGHALLMLRTLPVDAVITLFTGFDPSFREPLQLPHARDWMINLQTIAKENFV
jgi:hypothetical protein